MMSLTDDVTDRCTGADLYNICNHAAMKAAVDCMSASTIKDIEYAIDKVTLSHTRLLLAVCVSPIH